MSSTLGGPPPQDEAAKVLPLEPALDSEKDAVGHGEADMKSRSVQLSPSAASTDPGLNEQVKHSANGIGSDRVETVGVVESTGQQKAEEDLTIGRESAIENSGAEATSQPGEALQGVNKEVESSNTNEFVAQDSGRSEQVGSEVEGEAVAEPRTVYVTSQTSTATSASQGVDNVNKSSEDVTQSPPMLIPARRRVKVYALSAKTGAWDDRGTGCVDIRAWDTDVRYLGIFMDFRYCFLCDATGNLPLRRCRSDTTRIWLEARQLESLPLLLSSRPLPSII